LLLFDAETDGLLDTVTKLHCLNIIDRSTGERLRYNDGFYAGGVATKRAGSIADGLKRLKKAPSIAGQNIIGYDLPVLEKLYGFTYDGPVHDTLVYSRVIWPDIKDRDFAALRAGRLPNEFREKGLIGLHKLAAWGFRLDPDGSRGFRKGDFDPKDYGHTWETIPFIQEMDDYCAQDNEVTLAWLELIESKSYSPECLYLEQRVAQIISAQERNGFSFDVEAARAMYAELQKKKLELEQGLQSLFPAWEVVVKDFVPKSNNKKHGHVKGQRFIKKVPMLFNPGSRDHIADRLKVVHGWRPTEFTDTGKPKIDDEILSTLPYPEAKPIAEFLVLGKVLGMLGDGTQAWLKAERNGRIHGRVNSNGAVTGRMTHSSPNVAQVPKCGSPFGKECRALFRATPGMRQVGCDAEGLELRKLAHYMAAYDGGAYADIVVNGKKENGTDVHTVNKNAAGLNSRDAAKTLIYALLYGAGDFKLGSIVYDDFTDAQKEKFNNSEGAKAGRDRALAKLGGARRKRLMDNLPALGKLTDAVKAKARKTRKLRGIDGRILHVRSEHAALNTLLQSGGAVVMKKALVLLDDAIRANPKLRGKVRYLANVHDEFQLETTPELAETVGRLAADCIRLAGEHFNLRCPLAGDFAVGANWAETH
jgi:DNA polymerase-1